MKTIPIMDGEDSAKADHAVYISTLVQGLIEARAEARNAVHYASKGVPYVAEQRSRRVVSILSHLINKIENDSK